MNQLEATKQLNALKLYAIDNGGFEKHKTLILMACEYHKKTFGSDLTPKFWLKSKQCSEVLQLMDKDFKYCEALETVLKNNPKTFKNSSKMKDIKTTTINYKEISISEKFIGQYQVSVFDTERQKNTYRNYFNTLCEAVECFEELVEIQAEKMSYQF